MIILPEENNEEINKIFNDKFERYKGYLEKLEKLKKKQNG